MSDHPGYDDPRDGDDDGPLLDLLAAALTEDGELLPTEMAEVAQAEAQGVEEVELPASLRQLRSHVDEARPAVTAPAAGLDEDDEMEGAETEGDAAEGGEAESDEAERDESAGAGHAEAGQLDEGGSEAIDLAAYRKRKQAQTRPAPRRFGWMSHSAAGLLGAAAAALLIMQLQPERAPTVPTSEPAGLSSVPVPERLRVTLSPGACEGCCAGERCSTAKGDLAKCSSGRDCIPCDTSVLAKSYYRVRTGAVFTSELGNDTLKLYPKGELELCVRAGAAPEVCLPSYLNDRKTPYLSRLPVLVSKEDRGTVLHMRLHWKGVSGELGTPARVTTPIMLTPKSLCRGHRINFKTEKGEIFANMSLFLADTHYVEMKRAADSAALLEVQRSIEWVGVKPVLQETRSTAAERFVLAIGPLDLPAAEKIRWQLLDQKQEAVVTVGADYIGEPRELK